MQLVKHGRPVTTYFRRIRVTPLQAEMLDRRQPVHFVGVGGIGMSALAGILAARGYHVSGSDPRRSQVLDGLAAAGVRLFPRQEAATIDALLNNGGSIEPLVVISSAVPAHNAELQEARRRDLKIVHRSDVLAALIQAQPSIAVAGSHGKTTTSTLVATLLQATGEDPTAVIGGIVPTFASNGRHGAGRLLVAEADESDGSLVKFEADLAVLTNIELDHTDHYPDLAALIGTLQHFAARSRRLLANHDDPILQEHFQARYWWSTQQSQGVDFALLPLEERGDGTTAAWYEAGSRIATLELPLPGRHNLSNAAAALAACRIQGVDLAALQQAIALVSPPGRRFDCRGIWQGRIVVDDYAHHPSEVEATLKMARLMVESGRSPLPRRPERLLAVFQPHRYSRTAQFLEEFAAALRRADLVLVAPLYSAGEAPIAGISSAALAEAIRRQAPQLPVQESASLEELANRIAALSRPGDLVLAMGAGDVNSLWDRLSTLDDRTTALVA